MGGENGNYSVMIRRWADKFCLHCNIFIYLRHIWIKPVLLVALYLSSIILYLEHTDAYRPHSVHIEMEEFSDVRFMLLNS
jgi:hypothetical protein